MGSVRRGILTALQQRPNGAYKAHHGRVPQYRRQRTLRPRHTLTRCRAGGPVINARPRLAHVEHPTRGTDSGHRVESGRELWWRGPLPPYLDDAVVLAGTCFPGAWLQPTSVPRQKTTRQQAIRTLRMIIEIPQRLQPENAQKPNSRRATGATQGSNWVAPPALEVHGCGRLALAAALNLPPHRSRWIQ